jgi:hypothetical protein
MQGMRGHHYLAIAITLLSVLSYAPRARAFSLSTSLTGSTLQETFELAPRWSSLSGLDDGIQVGVHPDFASSLSLTSGEELLIEQRVLDAFGTWGNSALDFDITMGAAGTVEGTNTGFEFDLFAVGNSHSVFASNNFFGFTTVDASSFSSNRPLTNGQSFPGYSITGVDIYINVDNLAFLEPLGQATRLDVLTRILIHEIGHGIGLGHPNSNNPLGVQTNYDTDFDPLNSMSIDPNDPFSALLVSDFRNDQAIMSNGPCGVPAVEFCAAAAFTTLQLDDAGGRDALYPAAPEPLPALNLIGMVILLSMLGATAYWRLRDSASAA